MTRAKADIFKQNGKTEIFVIGDNDEERAQILYIRSGLTAGEIIKRLKNYSGVVLELATVKGWIKKGEWLGKRKAYKVAYESKLSMVHAEKQATTDNKHQDDVRSVYADLSAHAMNIIKQKFDFTKPKFANAPIIDSKELLNLSQAMKNFADVHFRALGIAEVAVVDPTSQNKGIRIYTNQDVKRLESSDDE